MTRRKKGRTITHYSQSPHVAGAEQLLVAALQDMIYQGDHLRPVFLEGAADRQIVGGVNIDKLQVIHIDVFNQIEILL